MPAASQHEPRENTHETQIWHWDVPAAHKPARGPWASRRHLVLCDGVVVEFGVEFATLDGCPRLRNMIQHSEKKSAEKKKT